MAWILYVHFMENNVQITFTLVSGFIFFLIKHTSGLVNVLKN